MAPTRHLVVFSALAVATACQPDVQPTVEAGFSQVHVGSDVDDGQHVSLVLDGDDQPMVAYLKEVPNDDANSAVHFTRYDAAAKKWTTPVVVAAGVGRVDGNPTLEQVKLARDASTGRLGIAFQKTEEFCAGVNKESTVHVSFSTDDGATWSASERVSEAKYTRNDPVTGVAVCNTDSPRIAMANGVVHVAWGAAAGELQSTQLSYWAGYYYASSSSPGAWTRTLLPHGGDDARKGRNMLSLALDSAGAPAVAYAMTSVDSSEPYTTAVLYWRPGGSAVRVVDSNNNQNDFPQVSLAFDGTRPRVAAKLTRSDADREAIWAFRSDDGAAFAETRVPDDATNKAGSHMDLTWRGGKGALAYEYGSSSGAGQCGGPKLSRSTDAQTWTTCGADDKDKQFLGKYVSAELTSTGKLVIAFQATSADDFSPARFDRGIVLWREP